MKKLREDRCKTKREVSQGIVSDKTYSKIEKGVASLNFNDLTKVLKNLDLTLEEFTYQYKMIYEDPFSKGIEKIREITHSNNKESLKKSTDAILKDKKLSYKKKKILICTLNCISNLNDGEIELAKKHANVVWDYLKDFDTLYAYDLFFLTHIFIAFTGETLDHVVEKIRIEIPKWKDFKNFQIVEISFYLNYGKYLELEKRKEEAINIYQEALRISKLNNNALYTSVSMIRLGRLIKDNTFIDSGIYILNIFDPDLCNNIMKEE
ncbi:helix-turn-helix domain-containing protein [Staphylococcus epidermidis]|uniref:helix-turn-helix domain-containing protein n=2 Tax=Staphylococcus epidermidis TaxID=1282 RepID=UPI0025574744|nr:helix-turn-helix transcriptional regulator [Staphylococcus epidermidis]